MTSTNGVNLRPRSPLTQVLKRALSHRRSQTIQKMLERRQSKDDLVSHEMN